MAEPIDKKEIYKELIEKMAACINQADSICGWMADVVKRANTAFFFDLEKNMGSRRNMESCLSGPDEVFPGYVRSALELYRNGVIALYGAGCMVEEHERGAAEQEKEDDHE